MGMTKKPDEIKKGLECCKRAFVYNCGDKCDTCDLFIPAYIKVERCADALAYIQQLEEANQNFVNVINALSEKVPQWISVEERLPESEQCVLICYKSGFISIGYWCEDFVEWDGMTDEEISRPDYWMPLPEPVRDADELPKEG